MKRFYLSYSTNYLSMLLYFSLGMAMNAVGVKLFESPLNWFSILFIVIAIDLNSSYVMWRSTKDNE